jgi:esterase/lipase
MSDADKEVLKNESVTQVIEDMFKESFRNGSKGIAYEVSKLLVNDWNFKLNKIQRPITFWQGKKDNNVPYKWAELMSNQIPNAKLNIYPDEGHLIIFNHALEIFTELKKTIPNRV